MRWTQRTQWHVTVEFLGRVDDAAVLADALRVATATLPPFTMTLAAQYADYGIRANAIAPGTVRTERNKSRYETKEFLPENGATPAARARAALAQTVRFCA
jgi:NAD(P)-dependent dehydrogenase (short-subunit alcohol dehydrogenase family)